MKKTILLGLLLLGGVQTVLAQHTIEKIRKAYQRQKEYIEAMSDSFPSVGIPAEYYRLRVAHNLPGTGPHYEDISMYFAEVESEDEDAPPIYAPHYLTFATTSYNYAARRYYEEYLYDNKGQVMFIYARTPDFEYPKVHEFRLYFNGERLLRLNVKESEVTESFDGPFNFKEVYTGTTIPEVYKNTCTQYINSANAYLVLFKDIESKTYIGSN